MHRMRYNEIIKQLRGFAVWKIEITWKQLYEDIYVKFTKMSQTRKHL